LAVTNRRFGSTTAALIAGGRGSFASGSGRAGHQPVRKGLAMRRRGFNDAQQQSDQQRPLQ
jgi:hypothetical protein